MKPRTCRYRCINIKRRYAAYFANTLRYSSLVSILVTLACADTESHPLLCHEDIMESHIRPLLIHYWLRCRIKDSLALKPYPWVILRHTYSELLPPVHTRILSYSTVYHIIKVGDVVFKIPAYFWCDNVYLTTICPSHHLRYTPKKFYKFI